jgi:CubicO group peptidase (beta-lactamase class C family)
MADTVMTLSADQKRRLAPGHRADGTPVANWDLPVLAGAGALRSTVGDMLRYLEATINDEAGEAYAVRANAGAMRIGLAWHLTPLGPNGPAIVWHNGGTGGYHCYAGFVKQTRTAVVVLGNTTAQSDRLAVDLLKLLQSVQ